MSSLNSCAQAAVPATRRSQEQQEDRPARRAGRGLACSSTDCCWRQIIQHAPVRARGNLATRPSPFSPRARAAGALRIQRCGQQRQQAWAPPAAPVRRRAGGGASSVRFASLLSLAASARGTANSSSCSRKLIGVREMARLVLRPHRWAKVMNQSVQGDQQHQAARPGAVPDHPAATQHGPALTLAGNHEVANARAAATKRVAVPCTQLEQRLTWTKVGIQQQPRVGHKTAFPSQGAVCGCQGAEQQAECATGATGTGAKLVAVRGRAVGHGSRSASGDGLLL